MSDGNEPDHGRYFTKEEMEAEFNLIEEMGKGLTKLEYFAAFSMMGIRSRSNSISIPPEKMAELAVADARALIELISKENE